MLKSWLSSYGYPSTTAGPIVATTITIEAIQDLLHANGFPIEGTYVLLFFIIMAAYNKTLCKYFWMLKGDLDLSLFY